MFHWAKVPTTKPGGHLELISWDHVVEGLFSDF